MNKENYRLSVLLIGLLILGSQCVLPGQEMNVLGLPTFSETSKTVEINDSLIQVGYNLMHKKAISGAISEISAENFNQGYISDPLLLMQGRLAGVQIYNRGGDPNIASLIRIRGLSAFSQRDPLYVIDGLAGASIKNLDPNDIASITILKDGATQAIYGIRASNGVILINTKAGDFVKDTISVEYQGQLATSSAHSAIPILTAEEFRQAGGVDLGSATSWLDEIIQNGPIHVQSLAINGRKGRTSYRISGNYRNVNGVLRNTGLNQINLRSNLGLSFLDQAIQLNLCTAYTNRKGALGFNEAFRYAISSNPTAPVYASDAPFPYNQEQFGGYFEKIGLFDAYNPVALINLNDRNGALQSFTTSANLKYVIRPDISINVRYGFQDQFSNERAYYSPQSYFRGNAYTPLDVQKGRADLTDVNDLFHSFELFGNIHRAVSDANVDLTIGTSYQNGDYLDQYLRLDGFSNSDLVDIERITDYNNWENEAQTTDTINNGWSNKLSALFGRMHFNLKNQFYADVSFRYEGSSKLGVNKRWGLFPAIGMAFDFKNIWNVNSVDKLKLRMGYGVTGSIPDRGGLSQQKTLLIIQENGTIIPNILRQNNPNLKWEQKNEINIGFDFEMGSFAGFVDVYSREVKDWIMEVSSLFPNDYLNQNTFKSTGIEIGLDFTLVNTRHYKYASGIVLATNQIKYTDIVDNPGFTLLPGGIFSEPAITMEEGETVGRILGPIFDGVDQEGFPLFEDINNDGQIFVGSGSIFQAEGDNVQVGNGLPDLELGWNHRINVAEWQLQMVLRGAFGHSLVNMNRMIYEPRYNSPRYYNIVDTDLAVENLRMPIFSSLYIEKANFLKLDNLSISRTFQIGLGSRKSNLSLSVMGQNLIVLSNYSGADPEPVLQDLGATSNGSHQSEVVDGNILAPGVDRRHFYLPSRTLTIGMRLTF